jgi:hypothetical protein
MSMVLKDENVKNDDPTEATKQELERRKLELEIRELSRPWYGRVSYLQPLAAVAISVISALLLWVNGYFSTQLTRLDNRQFELKQQNSKLEQDQANLKLKRAEIDKEIKAALAERDTANGERDRAIKDLARTKTEKEALAKDVETARQQIHSLSISTDWLALLEYVRSYLLPSPVAWERRTQATLTERRKPVIRENAAWKRLVQDLRQADLKGKFVNDLLRPTPDWEEEFIGYLVLCDATNDDKYCNDAIRFLRIGSGDKRLPPPYILKLTQEFSSKMLHDFASRDVLCSFVKLQSLARMPPLRNDVIGFARGFGSFQELFVGTDFANQCPDIVFTPIAVFRSEYERDLLFAEENLTKQNVVLVAVPRTGRIGFARALCDFQGLEVLADKVLGMPCEELPKHPKLERSLKDPSFGALYDASLLLKFISGQDIAESEFP